MLVLFFILGAFTLTVQSLVVREALVAAFGSELSLGVTFFGWLAGVALGALAASRIGGSVRRRRTLFTAAVTLLALSGPGEVVLVRLSRAFVHAGPGEFIPLTTLLWMIPLLTVPFCFLAGFAFPLGTGLLTRGERSARPVARLYAAEALGSLTGGALFSFLLIERLQPLPFAAAGAVVALGTLSISTWRSLRKGGRTFLSDANRDRHECLSSCGKQECLPYQDKRTSDIPVRHEPCHGCDSAAVPADNEGGKQECLPYQDRRRSDILVRQHRGQTGMSVLLPAVAGMLLLVALAAGGVWRLRTWSIESQWKSFATGTKRVAPTPVDSRYQHIALGERQGEFTVFLDGLAAMHFPAPWEHAPAAHFVMTEAENPGRVLLVGAGVEGLLAEMLKHPVERLDYVLLDPKLLDVIAPHLPRVDRAALADARVHVHYDDGRRFLAEAGDRRWDLVFLDVPEPTSVLLNRFYTAGFFRLVRAHLADDGLLALRLTGTAGYLSRERVEALGTVWNALGEVFGHRLATWGERTWFLAASRPGVFTADGEQLAKRYRSRGVQSEVFDPALFEGATDMLQPDKLRELADALAGASHVPPNTDAHPRASLFNTILLERMVSGRRSLLEHLDELTPMRALLGVAVLFVAWMLLTRLLLRRRARRASALFSVATTALGTMSLELVLLTAFQSLYGYIYVRIGLIVGTFMFGLVAGSLLMDRALARYRWGRRALGRLDLLLAALLAATPFTLGALASAPRFGEAVLMLLVFISGLLGGLVFPLGAKVLMTPSPPGGAGSNCETPPRPALSPKGRGNEDAAAVTRAAGATAAADQWGACVGALLTGVVLIAALGIAATCLLLAVVKVLSAVQGRRV